MKYFHPLPSGLRMHYEIRGKTDSKYPPMVFLNGLSQSTEVWGALIHPEIAEKFICILVDLIFQGKSDHGDTFRTFEQHADDLYHLLSTLGHPSYNIVGISYGGAVVQRFMVRYPQTCHKAFLLSTFSYKTPYFDCIGESWKQALLCGGYDLMFEVMLPFVLGKSYFDDPIIAVDDLKNAKKAMSPKAEDLLKLMEATERSGNYLSELTDCRIETTIVHGEEDILCTPEMGSKMAEVLPNSELIILPKVGHTLNLEAINQLKNILLMHAEGGKEFTFSKKGFEV